MDRLLPPRRHLISLLIRKQSIDSTNPHLPVDLCRSLSSSALVDAPAVAALPLGHSGRTNACFLQALKLSFLSVVTRRGHESSHPYPPSNVHRTFANKEISHRYHDANRLRRSFGAVSGRSGGDESPKEPLSSDPTDYFERFEKATNVYALLKQKPWGWEAIKALEELDIKFDSVTVQSVIRRDLPVSTVKGFFGWLQLRNGFTHDMRTYFSMIDKLGEAGLISEMQEMIEEFCKAGYGVSPGLVASIISWCRRANDVDSAVKFWETLKKRSPLSYNVMIDALANAGRYKEAADLYLEMVEKDRPNSWTFAAIIHRLAQAGKLDAAYMIQGMLPKLKVRPVIFTFASLMSAYARVGDVGMVKRVAMDLKEVNFGRGEEFVSVVKALMKAGKVEQADLVAQEIWPELSEDDRRERFLKLGLDLKASDESKGGEANSSSELFGLDAHDPLDDEDEDADILLSDMRLKGVSRMGLSAIGLAKAIQNWNASTVAYMERMNINWDNHVAFQVIRRIKELTTALDFFEWLSDRPGFKHDLYTYTFIVIKVAQAAHFAIVQQLLADMQQEGLCVSISTLNTVIRYCSKSRKSEYALHFFSMVKEFGLEPNEETYGALIHVLCREKNAPEALKFFKEMQRANFQPGVITFAQLIHCVGFTGGTETAHWLFQQMPEFGLEPGAHHYAGLMHAYNKAGQKQTTLKLFDEMREAGIEIPSALYPVFKTLLQQCGRHKQAKKLESENKNTVNHKQAKKAGLANRARPQDLRLVYDVMIQSFVEGKGFFSVG